jgi:energy-coupling factor transport system ATP-binding protein
MKDNQALLELRDVTCRRRGAEGGEEISLAGVSLQVREGEILVVLGAAGAGKTTLAAVLAGVTRAAEGELVRKDSLGQEDGSNLPIGLIAQNPEDTFTSPVVREEMGLVLQNLEWDDGKIDQAVDAMLAEVRLKEYADTHPALLSGGQKQLLAAASIIIAEPTLLILDEPLSLLDSRGREEVETLLARRGERGSRTAVFLSSEVEDVLRGDRIVVLSGGRLVWEGKRDDFPLSPEVLSPWGLLPPDLTCLAQLLFPSEDSRRRRIWTPEALAGAL